MSRIGDAHFLLLMTLDTLYCDGICSMVHEEALRWIHDKVVRPCIIRELLPPPGNYFLVRWRQSILDPPLPFLSGCSVSGRSREPVLCNPTVYPGRHHLLLPTVGMSTSIAITYIHHCSPSDAIFDAKRATSNIIVSGHPQSTIVKHGSHTRQTRFLGIIKRT